MRKLPFAILLLTAGILAVGCSHEDVAGPTAPPVGAHAGGLVVDADAIASGILAATGWEAVAPAVDVVKTVPAGLYDPVREDLAGGLAHYSFDIAVGDGPYETIRLHRVVRESAPGRPIRTERNLFALHGSPGSFSMMFLYGVVATSVPDDRALAVDLALQDVDVWGIDRSCNFVPADETDFSFMADWGLQYNVDALRAGMAVARAVRTLTGNGPAPLNLLAFSSGVPIGYAAAGQETQLPPSARLIGGLIPVDSAFVTDPGPDRDRACATYDLLAPQLAAGVYAGNVGAVFNTFGWLARTDPDGASPIVPGLNNRLTAILVAATTWQFFAPPGNPPTHFFGGVFDAASGLPVDLAYTDYENYLDFLLLAPPWEEQALTLESAAVACGAPATPFDDVLAAIRVPVLHVGAAGGIAPRDDATLGRLGSSDVTTLTVRLLPPEAALLDMGHVDLFTSDEAAAVFWQPLAEWIFAHCDGGGRGVGKLQARVEH